MSFAHAARTCFSRFLSFTGRSARLGYCLFPARIGSGFLVVAFLDNTSFEPQRGFERDVDGLWDSRNAFRPFTKGFGIAASPRWLADQLPRVHDVGNKTLIIPGPVMVSAGETQMADRPSRSGCAGGRDPMDKLRPDAGSGGIVSVRFRPFESSRLNTTEYGQKPLEVSR